MPPTAPDAAAGAGSLDSRTGGADPFAAYEAARPSPDGRPWLIANMVAGLDGSLAWHGRVGGLSSASDRSLFVRLRGLADVVLVGAGTVRAEGYGPVRLPDEVRDRRQAAGRSPVPPLAVVSRSLDLDWSKPLGDGGPGTRPLVVTSAAAPPDAMARAEEHADVLVGGDATVDLAEALGLLAARGARVVVTEGGPTLLDELVGTGLLDELCLTLTPRFGGDPLTMAHRAAPAAEMAAFTLEGVVREDDELYLRYLLDRSRGGAGDATEEDDR